MKTNATFPSEDDSTRPIEAFILLIGLAFLMLFSLTSCNTTRGFGRDVQKVGDEIEEAADRVTR